MTRAGTATTLALVGFLAAVGLLAGVIARGTSLTAPRQIPTAPTVSVSPVSAAGPPVRRDPTATLSSPTRAIPSSTPRPTATEPTLQITRTTVATLPPVENTPSHPVAVAFPSASQGWLLNGDCGGVGNGACTIFATTDSGITWHPQFRTHLILRSLVFFNADDGWVPGEDCAVQGTRRSCSGILLITTNGGTTWTTKRAGGVLLSDLQFVSPRLGWAVASICPLGKHPCSSNLRQSTDGGATWQTVPLGDFWVSAVRFVDAQRGWIAGCTDSGDANWTHGCTYPEVRATSDGCKTWQTQMRLPATEDSFGASLDFVDARDGWLMTSSPHGCTMGGCWGPLYQTSDGGRTWALLQTEYRWQVTGDLNGVPPGFPGAPAFASPTVGWIPIAAGAGPGMGGIARSVDGGKTWVRSGGLKGWEIGSVSAVSPRSVWIVGSRRFTDLSFLLHSDDGGQTWTQRLPIPAPVQSIDFLDSEHGWGIATSSDPGAVLATADGGHTWHQLASIDDQHLLAVSFVDHEHGCLAGQEAKLPQSTFTVLETDDGGHTWHAVSQMADPIVALKFFSARDGVLLTGHDRGGGLPATVQVTHDGGASWSRVGQVADSGQAISVRAADWINLTIGWIVTLDRSGRLQLLTTKDDGRSWQSAGTILQGPVWSTVSLRVVSDKVGWLAFGQTLLMTDDGGQTWTQVMLPSGVAISSLDVVDANVCWLLTTDGRLFHTVDRGETWIPVATPSSATARS